MVMQNAGGTAFRACLHGGGEPQIGEVTCGGSPHLSRKHDQIKMRDYTDRRVTPPKRVTSPIWGPPPRVNRPLVKTLQSRRLLQGPIKQREIELQL